VNSSTRAIANTTTKEKEKDEDGGYDTDTRMYIRQLEHTEFPLPIYFLWKFRNMNCMFTVKRREIDAPTLYTVLRMVLYSSNANLYILMGGCRFIARH
jgi:hypothetical protein